jgi:hypothetical protein
MARFCRAGLLLKSRMLSAGYVAWAPVMFRGVCTISVTIPEQFSIGHHRAEFRAKYLSFLMTRVSWLLWTNMRSSARTTLRHSLFLRIKSPVTMADGHRLDCWMYAYNRERGSAPLWASQRRQTGDANVGRD